MNSDYEIDIMKEWKDAPPLTHEQKVEIFGENYDIDANVFQFIDTPYHYGGWVCDSCEATCGHPLQYCYKCPGKLVRNTKTYRQYLMDSMRSGREFTYSHEKNVMFGEYLKKFTNRKERREFEEDEPKVRYWNKLVDEIIRASLEENL